CQGQDTGEQALFRQLLGALGASDVVLADRLYCTYWMVATLKARAVDVLMHQNASRSVDLRRGKRLGRGDHLIHWSRPARPAWMDKQIYQAMPETRSVREVRVHGRVLVTTLLDAHAVPAAGTRPALRQALEHRSRSALDQGRDRHGYLALQK